MKVFSVEKYIKIQEHMGHSYDRIREGVECWANSCDGLTEDEMKAKGYVTLDSWMEERKEDK